MRVGIVSKWIASGQAVVARQIRSALEELGHETFVLARPGSGPRAQKAASAAAGDIDEVWDQPGITEASEHHVPLAEYEDWVRANSIEAVLCDENYQFDEIHHLRQQGVRTIGRFVWEYFGDEYVARRAHRLRDDLLADPLRARSLRRSSASTAPTSPGESTRSCSSRAAAERDEGNVSFYFPGSFLGRRKPIRKVVKAFGRAPVTSCAS